MISKKNSLVMRGVAILIVMASHYAEWMLQIGAQPVHLRTRELVGTWGTLGVDLFFLVSGYGLYKSAEQERQRQGRSITRRFILRRVTGAVLPYLILAALIEWYSGGWAAAAADGAIGDAFLNYLTARSFWYMRVQFVFYALFILAFLFGRGVRLILLAAGVVAYTVWMMHAGYIDFWTLSNGAFLIGVGAAAAEEKAGEKAGRRKLRLLFLILSVACMLITWQGMLRNGGSGIRTAYYWELAVNIFFTLTVLFAVSFLPDVPGHILSSVGAASLYIYLLHQVIYWALIFRFFQAEPAPGNYLQSILLIGLITIGIGVLIFFSVSWSAGTVRRIRARQASQQH